MSVIVRGMEMPDSCAVCRFAGKGGYHMERVVCMFTGKNEDAKNVDRLSDCPLVALPDKHGRLVDADALRDRLRSLADDGWNKSTTTSWAEAFSECEDMVDDAPTIEPRKKGKWLPDNNSLYEMRFVCSECHESEVVPTIGFTKYKPIWDFCPNCGADMREGEADADVKS